MLSFSSSSTPSCSVFFLSRGAFNSCLKLALTSKNNWFCSNWLYTTFKQVLFAYLSSINAYALHCIICAGIITHDYLRIESIFIPSSFPVVISSSKAIVATDWTHKLHTHYNTFFTRLFYSKSSFFTNQFFRMFLHTTGMHFCLRWKVNLIYLDDVQPENLLIY